MASATKIAGRYQIEGRLGVGGMSTVHLAFDQRLERYVALKLLAEHLADDPAFVSRFRREALAAARLVHPNIVQVFDFGFDERQHQHFIVMEHVSGHSCAELLRDRGHLDVDQAVDIISQSCRGLEYAHRHGVVHRDVKPGNLLLSDAEVVKLADFGIARATDQSSITQVGSVLGTAAYLAPEQARGEEAGPQADIYSLGVVTYQLMSGRLPYEASSLSELALMQQRESPVPLDQLNNRIPPELAHAVAAALSIEKEERPTDALKFGETLQNGVHGIEPPRRPVAARGPTSETQLLGGREPATSATRIASRQTSREPAAGSAPARPVRKLEPQPYATGGYETRAPHERGAERRSRSQRRGRRIAGFLAMLCLLAALVIVAVLIATSTSNTAVQARKTIANDVNSAINQVQSLIGQYTK
jgi:eukaryotic-like serine/threonine-protein kinase